jgi:hypothetical protein
MDAASIQKDCTSCVTIENAVADGYTIAATVNTLTTIREDRSANQKRSVTTADRRLGFLELTMQDSQSTICTHRLFGATERAIQKVQQYHIVGVDTGIHKLTILENQGTSDCFLNHNHRTGIGKILDKQMVDDRNI